MKKTTFPAADRTTLMDPSGIADLFAEACATRGKISVTVRTGARVTYEPPTPARRRQMEREALKKLDPAAAARVAYAQARVALRMFVIRTRDARYLSQYEPDWKFVPSSGKRVFELWEEFVERRAEARALRGTS